MSNDKTITAPAFHILLALAEGERHGLGIAEEVEAITGGAVKLGPGTLYRSLKLMTADGLVRPASEPDTDAGDDPRRKYYRITRRGRAALEREAARFARLVSAAKARNVLSS